MSIRVRTPWNRLGGMGLWGTLRLPVQVVVRIRWEQEGMEDIEDIDE